jgi:hypothetical protein
MDIEVTELSPGELEVRAASRRYRVLVPAGVGVPGFADEELAAASIAELLARGSTIAAVVDLSRTLADDPGFLGAVERRLEQDGRAG